ncbi:MAG: hypothetical protein OXU68_15055 [Bacteroidota bacterium]|nr:hypothetical protein [Bacteroidota bacterium]
MGLSPEADRLLIRTTAGWRLHPIMIMDGVLPFSHRVWKHDLRNTEASYIRLAHDSGDISRYAQAADSNDIGEAMAQLESALGLFLLEDHFKVLSKRQRRLGLCSYSEGRNPHHIDFARGGRFYSLNKTGSESGIYEFLQVAPPGSRCAGPRGAASLLRRRV